MGPDGLEEEVGLRGNASQRRSFVKSLKTCWKLGGNVRNVSDGDSDEVLVGGQSQVDLKSGDASVSAEGGTAPINLGSRTR